MLKILTVAAAIGAFAFALSVAGLSVWRSFYQQNHQTSHEAGEKETTEKSGHAAGNIATKERADEAIAHYTLWLMLFTGVLAFVALIQIGFLIRADETASETALAAKNSAEVAKETLVVAHRPWISIDPINGISISSPLAFNAIKGEGASLGVRYIFRNTGASPALHVTWRSKFIILSMTKPTNIEFSEQQITLCDPMREISSAFLDSSIFPMDKIIQEQGLGIAPNEIEAALKARETGPFAHGGFISMGLVVCIDYQTSLASDVHHQTRYAFFLGIPLDIGFMGGIKPEGTRTDVRLIYFSQSAD